MGLLIHEVATKANIHTATVRRAEKRGVITSQRDCNNWRRYSPDVVEKLKKLYVQNDDSR
jgi:DNA-binding transcriptional MerR regulator